MDKKTKEKMRAEAVATPYTNKNISLAGGIIITLAGVYLLVDGLIKGIENIYDPLAWAIFTIAVLILGIYSLYSYKLYRDAEKD